MAEIKTIIRADSTQHDSTVKKSANEVYKYQKKVNSAKESLGTMTASIGKFAGALGISIGVLGTFTKGLKELETINDELAFSQQATTTAVKEFFLAIQNGNFLPFLDGLGSIIDKAKEAYQAIDDLGTFKNFENKRVQEIEVRLNEAKLNLRKIQIGEIADPTGELKKQWQNTIKELEGDLKKSLEDEIAITNMAIEKQTQKILGEFGEEYREEFEKYTNGGTAYVKELKEDLQSLYNELNSIKPTESATFVDIQTGQLRSGGLRYSAEDEMRRQKLQERINFYNRIIDLEKDITERNQLQVSLYQAMNKEIQTELSNRKFLKETTSGGSGSKGGSSNSPTYETGSLAELKAKLRELKDIYENNNLSIEEANQNLKEQAELEEQILNIERKRHGMPVVDLIPELKPISTEQALQSITNLKTPLEEVKQEFVDLIALGNSFGETTSAISSIFNSLGDIAGETDGQMLKMFGDIAGHISNILPKIFSLTAAEEGEAMAAGTASAAKLPFPYNLGAIASIIAELIAVFATISSYSKFAEGGIVGGNSTIGDYNLARVNKGEMILNGKQQAHLFNMLNGIGVPSNNGVSGSVVFRISGNDLVGTLNNYNKRMGRVN